MKKLASVGGVAGLVIAIVLARGHAATPALATAPMADITDLYAWNVGSNLNLVMDVSPLDGGTFGFDPSVLYVFHLTSKPGDRLVPGSNAGTETRVICRFASNASVECWVTGAAGTKDYLTGDPSAVAGIVSPRGKLRVFAGRRSDPAFAKQQGFDEAVGLIKTLLSMSSLDPARCPTDLDPAGAMNIRNALARGVDSFATSNIMAIVVQIDKSLVLTEPDKIVAVWGSTHAGS